MKKITFLSFSILFLFLSANAQTGPGGVGNSDGSNGQPQNVIWFAADNLSLSDTDPVSAWSDLSGNGNDASQPTATNQPTYQTGEINGLPAVVFDGSNDFMPFDGNLITNSDYTVLFVGKRLTSNYFRVFMGGTASGANQNLHLLWNNDSQFRAHHWGNDLQTDMVANTETYSSGTDANEYGIFATLLASTESADQRRNYQNNHYLGNRDNASQLTSYTGSAIGRYESNFHEVAAAEIIIFSNALNDAQLQIVNQYLEIKYGITIDNDLYSPLASHTTDFAGIGEEVNGEHSRTSSGGIYLDALSGLNIGDYVFTSHNNLANSSADFSVADLPAGSEIRYNRTWYVEEVNTPDVRIAFDFSEACPDGLNPVNPSNYVLLYRSGTSGTFSKVQNADGTTNGDQVYFNLTSAELQSGYYTLATEDNANSPLQGVAGRTWYSLVSGEWDNWQTWTLDPSGVLPNNPDMLTPTSSPTSNADKVVILSGKTVTINSASPTANNKTNSEIEVVGTLDINTTTGHNFGTIRGTGRIFLKGDNFPTGDASHFTTAGQGEGTVVYQGGSYSLPTAQTFFNVEINLDNNANILTLTNDYQINGSLTVENGVLQINDATNDQIINLNIEKDLTVLANGKITVGTGNPFATKSYAIGGTMPVDNGELYHDIYHQINIKGNFTNNGIVKLTNQTNPEYGTLTTTGAATLRFVGLTSSKATLNNTTWLYNLVLDKGIDKTYQLEVFAATTDDFVLFGANNVGRNVPTGFTTENPQVRKALFVRNGTIKFTGNIFIPTLSEGAGSGSSGGSGDYYVGKNARFWVAGTGVEIYVTANSAADVTGFTPTGVNTATSNQAMSVYGEFKISDGLFGTKNSAGFIFWTVANAQIKVEGGNVDISQIRAAGGGGVFSYIQSGGTVLVRGNETEVGEVSADPLFEIEDPSGIFNMSGGEIIFKDAGGSDVNGIYVPTPVGNYNVTGGKITIDIRSGNDFEIGMTAPVWDLEIKRLSGTGTSIVRLTEDFTILGDLTINPNCRLDVQDDFDASIHDLSIGDDFTLEDGGEYLAHTNTTHFISNKSSLINIKNTANPGELKLHNVDIYKDQRWNNALFHRVEVKSGGRLSDNHPLEILGNLTITRGEFDVDEWEVDVKGNIEIVDGRIFSSETSKPEGWIVLNGTALQTLKGAFNAEQEFGNFELDNANGAKLLSDVNVTDFILTQGVMDLDIYNMEAKGAVSTTGTYSASLMFQTAGNAGDGGLSLYISGNGTYLFPIGTNANATIRYTPASIDLSDYVDDGFIQINVADTYLPTAISPGGESLSYYWRSRNSGFSTAPNAVYTFLAHDSDDPVNNSDGDISIPSGRVGEILEESPFTRSVVNGGVNTPSNMYFQTTLVPLTNADYTVGKNACFTGTLDVYYTTRVGIRNWNDQTKWTKTSDGVDDGNSGYPEEGDVAIIKTYGDANGNAWVYGNMDITVGALIFENGGGWPPRLWVNKNDANLDLGNVSGSGEMYLEVTQTQSPAFVGNTDLGDFVNEPSSVFNFKIDADNQLVDMPNNIPVYPNIRIEGGDGANDDDNRILRTSIPITVNGRVMLDRSSRWRLNHDVTINEDLRITWQANRTTVEIGDQQQITLKVGNDLRLENGNGNDGARFLVKNDNQNSFEHIVQIGGNIEIEANLDGTSTLDFYNGLAPNNNAILELTGENNATFTNASSAVLTPDLYRLVMNKGGVGNPRFDFDDAFALNGATDSEPKAIELISGTLNLNDAGINVTLTSGGADFKIPAEAQLHASHATLNVSGTNTGVWLDGKIRVGYGSNWLLNQGTNNYIEYTSSGTSEIAIFQGDFFVGSQIRRSTSTDEGILIFNLAHDNSTVVIGTDATIPDNGRSTFEVLNIGSEFTQVANSKITIANAPQNNKLPAFYLDVDVANADIQTGSIIQLGNANTQANQDFGIYSTNTLQNLTLDNTSGNNPKATMWTIPLTLNENLLISASTEFDANGLNLNIGGDFTNNGLFTANSNLTTFNGSADQNISGATSFHDLVYATANVLNINSPITILNDLTVSQTAATLSDNGNTITVLQDVDNLGTHTYGGSGDGILMQGLQKQTIYGDGIYGKLTIENASGVELDETSNAEIQINNSLKLSQGVFEINGHLLTLNAACMIEEANPFGLRNMIQTNLSFADNGVKKVFPAGTGSFTFPIGSQNKYTPIDINVTENLSTGELTVKAANERHPTIVENSETICQFTDIENVLQYYWLMRANGFTDATGTVHFYYDNSDISVSNACSLDEYDYITARILSDASGDINKFTDVATFDESGKRLVFNFINTNDQEISGDYLAGLEQAIPEEIPIYETKNNGLWTDETTWNPEIAGGPRGAIAIVNPAHTVTVQNDGDIFSYITEVNGRVEVNKTVFHRIGIVKGTGTIYMQHGDLPGGFYADFVSETGGTFEFGSDAVGSNYSVLGGFPEVNNLVFSGKGNRNLPNYDLNILGNLTINGDDNTLNVINEYDNKINLNGDFTYNNGSFDAGSGATAIFEFSGLNRQTISGSGTISGTNAFNYLVMNNPDGVENQIPVEIDETLDFQSGIIHNDGNNAIILNKTDENVITGIGRNTYIDGTVGKNILTSGNFIFPVGNSGRLGFLELNNANSNNYFYAEYINHNPTDDGYLSTAFASPLQVVSTNEYWRVNSVAGASAYVKLRWDNLSGASSIANERDDMRVAEWSSTNSEWETCHNNETASGTQTAGNLSTATTLIDLENDNFFAIASITVRENVWEGDISTSWEVAGNWSLNSVPTSFTNVTIPTAPIGGVFPEISTSENALKLTIEPSASVTINPSSSLTLFGEFVNNGTLNIKTPNDSTASGSFIDNGTISGSGNANIERYFTANMFHYVSSPIQLGGNAGSDLFTANPSGNFNPNFYQYDETFDLDGNVSTAPALLFDVNNLVPGWTYAHDNGSSNVSMQPKTGYAFYTDMSQTVTFSGSPNTADMSISGLTHTPNDVVSDDPGTDIPELYDGWNLVANPYPSTIDWDLVKNNLTNIDEGIYVWDVNQYASYVNGISSGSGNLDNNIAPMQAFYVHANANGAGFELNNSHRKHSTANYLKSEEKNSPNNLVQIKIEANNFTDIANIYYKSNATNGFEGRYDALCLFAQQAQIPNIYSVSENGLRFSTNGRALQNIENDVVPIGLRLFSEGIFTINFAEIKGFDNVRIFFKDKYENETIDIKEVSNYTFEHNGELIEDRFEIIFLQNNAPVLNGTIENQAILEDELFEMNLPENLFTDQDFGDEITISANLWSGGVLPEWLAFNSENNTFAGTPENENVGEYQILITAHDTYNQIDTTSFILIVENTNDAPILQTQIQDIVILVDENLDFTFAENTFIDVDFGDNLSYTAELTSGGMPNWLDFDNENRTFSGTPTLSDVGTYEIQLRATDNFGAFAETGFNIEVQNFTTTDELAQTGIEIYPNPCTDFFNLDFNTNHKPEKVTIYDQNGKKVFEQIITNRQNKIDVSKLSLGTYSVKIETETEIVCSSIVKI